MAEGLTNKGLMNSRGRNQSRRLSVLAVFIVHCYQAANMVSQGIMVHTRITKSYWLLIGSHDEALEQQRQQNIQQVAKDNVWNWPSCWFLSRMSQSILLLWRVMLFTFIWNAVGKASSCLVKSGCCCSSGCVFPPSVLTISWPLHHCYAVIKKQFASKLPFTYCQFAMYIQKKNNYNKKVSL